MGMRELGALVILGASVVSACGGDQSVPTKTDYSALRELKVENAVADAQRAIAAKDFRLLAVMGFSIEVPGAGDDVPSLEKEYGTKVIPGTSDAIQGEEHKRLNDNARAYAKKYNEFILSSVKAPGP
jgi:hypothetical protein